MKPDAESPCKHARTRGPWRKIAGRGLLFLVLLAIPALVPAQLDAVVAAIGSQLVTERDLQCYLVELRIYDPSLEAAADADLRRETLPSVVDEFLLYRHFSVDDKDPPEEEVTRIVEEVWKDYEARAGSANQLDQLMRHDGLSPAEMRGWLADRARRSVVINRGLGARLDPSLVNRAADTPKDATHFQFAQIVILPASQSDASWNEAEKRALRVWNQIQSGTPFERAAAIESSDLATAPSGGMVGWMEARILTAEVAGALRGLDELGVSRPVRGADGFRIFKLLDYETPLRRDRRQALKEIRDGYLRRLRRESEIQLAPDYANALPGNEDTLKEPTVWEKIIGKTPAPKPTPTGS